MFAGLQPFFLISIFLLAFVYLSLLRTYLVSSMPTCSFPTRIFYTFYVHVHVQRFFNGFGTLLEVYIYIYCYQGEYNFPSSTTIVIF